MAQLSESTDVRLVTLLSWLAGLASVCSVVVGTSALAGCVFHVAILKSWLPGQVTVTANAGLCFLLLGMALWALWNHGSASAGIRRRFGQSAAAVAGLTGCLTVLENLLGWNVGIDQLLFAVGPGDEIGSLRPGLIPPLAGMDFIFLGAALLALDWRRKRSGWPAQWISLGALLGSTFAMMDWLLVTSVSQTRISLPGALAQFLLPIGIIAARPEWALRGMLISRSAGARLLRAAVPLALLVLSFFGWLISKALLGAVHLTWAQVVTLAVALSTLLIILLAWIARLLDGLDSLNTSLEERTTALEAEVADHLGAEARLRASEESCSQLLSAVREYAIYTLDTEGRVTSWNAGAAHISGYETEEVLGRHFSIFYTASDQKSGRWEHEIKEALEKGRYEEEGEWVRKDGSIYWTSVVTTPTYDAAGRLVGYSKVARDITERKRVGQALRESEARLNEIISLATDAIITVDEQQHILLFNVAAEKMFGCQASEAMGKPITRFMPQRFRDDHGEQMRRFGESGITNRLMGAMKRVSAMRSDGQEFQVETSISQAIIGGKKLFTAIVRDVTERVVAAEARERLAEIVDSSDDAIISKTLQGVITAWNPGAEKVFGYSATEAVGQSVLMLIPPERVFEEAEIIRRIGRGESVKHFETTRVRKDGQRIDVSVTISPIRDRSGTVIGASKVARDISERKRAEQALAESEERFSKAFRFSPIALVVLRASDRRIVEVNENFEEISGYTREEALGRTSLELGLMGLDERDKMSGPLIAGQRNVTCDITITSKNGEVRQVISSSQFITLRGELHYLGCWLNITERRRAESALRESEERFQAMANGIPQLAWMAEPDGAISWYNQRWYEYTGMSPEQMQGWGWQSVHDPKVLPQVLRRWEGAIAAGEFFDMEFPLRGADGVFRTFLSRVSPFKDGDGRVVRWFGTNTDISERKQAEEQLARQAKVLSESQEALESQTILLRSVLDSIGEGLIAADAEGKLLVWNPAAERILGIGESHVAPEQWSSHYGAFMPDMVTPFPVGQNPLARAIRGEESTAVIYLRGSANEQGVWIESSGRPLKGADGIQRGGVIALRDVTQKRAAEEEIRKLNDELEERIARRTAQLQSANRDLESFSYSVSHDLRTPLRHIAGFSRILVNEYGPSMAGDARGLLQHIEGAVCRMGLLVDGLLSLAKVGRLAVRPRRTELNAIVENVISMLEPECEGRCVEWRVAPLPAVFCDPVLMGQVLQNLLSNALKYSRGRTPAVIEVDSIQQPGKAPVIFVRDNGAGFDMRHATRLFGAFQRMHTEAEFEGTGVGLATVERIIKRHEGAIWAEAEVDHGATFFFRLGENDEEELVARIKELGAVSST